MNNLIDTVRNRMEKRAKYNRTLKEIRDLPSDVALDLGIFPGDARRLAYEAVYG